MAKDKKVKKSFEALLNQIQLYKNKGSFHAAKGIVNNIYDKEFKIPNVSVAVHRFGPIPVCVLPNQFELEFNGEKRKCNIGIYPYIKRGIRGNKNESLVEISKFEFLQSLKIRLDVIFKRYLEDVAENFFDIENHSDLPAAIKKAKSSETILSQSITTKIDIILSTTKGNSTQFFYDLTETKRDLINNYADTIFKVRYAKYYAYFFINELYKTIGFSSKDFKNKFRNLKLNEENYDSNINDDADLLLLRKSITNYETGKGRETLEEDLASQTSTLWVKRFIQFSSFIYYINKEQALKPHTTKIFLSNRFTKSNSQTLKVKIDGLISNYFSNRVELLAVKENSAGKFINEIVKSRIWLSNATYSVLPQNEDNAKANFGWIAKEAVYSESLKNKLLFILNKNQDESLIGNFKDYVIKLDSYLAPEARNIQASKHNIVKKLENKLHAKYDSHNIKDVLLNESLIEDIKSLIELKVLNIVEAWLNQFSDEVSSVILDMNSKLEYPCKISKASVLIFKKENAEKEKKKFRYVWAQIRKRKLLIDGKEYTLINSIGKGNQTKYKRNLQNVIKVLVGDDNIVHLLKRCYNLRDF